MQFCWITLFYILSRCLQAIAADFSSWHTDYIAHKGWNSYSLWSFTKIPSDSDIDVQEWWYFKAFLSKEEGQLVFVHRSKKTWIIRDVVLNIPQQGRLFTKQWCLPRIYKPIPLLFNQDNKKSLKQGKHIIYHLNHSALESKRDTTNNYAETADIN